LLCPILTGCPASCLATALLLLPAHQYLLRIHALPCLFPGHYFLHHGQNTTRQKIHVARIGVMPLPSSGASAACTTTVRWGRPPSPVPATRSNTRPSGWLRSSFLGSFGS